MLKFKGLKEYNENLFALGKITALSKKVYSWWYNIISTNKVASSIISSQMDTFSIYIYIWKLVHIWYSNEIQEHSITISYRGGLVIFFGPGTIWPNRPTNCRKCKSVGRNTQKCKCLHALMNFPLRATGPSGIRPNCPTGQSAPAKLGKVYFVTF